MAVYHHALVLINSSQDGVPLLQHAARMAEENGMRITIAHISTDYRALNYVSDSLRDDRVSQEVIQAKALLNELACTVSLPVDTLSLVTTRRFEDVETCVRQRQIDLIIAGHHNRLLGVLSSHSLEYINHLNLDVLIKHLLAQGGLQQRKTVFNKRGQRLRAAHQGHRTGQRRLLQLGDLERRVLQMGGVQRRQNGHR